MKREFMTSLFSADNTNATTVTGLAYHTPALKENLYTAHAMDDARMDRMMDVMLQ